MHLSIPPSMTPSHGHMSLSTSNDLHDYNELTHITQDILYFFFFLHVFMLMYAHMLQHVCGGQVNFPELAFFFQHACPRDGTLIFQLGVTCTELSCKPQRFYYYYIIIIKLVTIVYV